MLKRQIALLITSVFICICCTTAFAETIPDNENTQNTSASEGLGSAVNTSDTSYYFYYKNHEKQPRPETQVECTAENVSATATTDCNQVADGKSGVVLGEKNSFVEWNVEIPEEGKYCININYYQLPGTGADVEFSVLLDNKIPFNEAENMSIPRFWKDASKQFERDNIDNDLRPKQIESPVWSERFLIDSLAQYEEPYLFYFTKGTHSIKLSSLRENCLISSVALVNVPKNLTYDQYVSQYKSKPDNATAFVLETEHALDKNSSLTYPIYDRSSVATTPSSPSRIRLNTIGGNNWSKNGNIIRWEIDVKNEGWYNLAFRARQNYSQGMISYRRLKIDGEVPFEEANSIPFAYNDDWYIKTLGDKYNPRLIYLTSGKHIMSLESVAGKMAPVLRGVSRVTLDLNAIYRKVVMVTGVNPDIYRDYQLEKQIPDLVTSMKDSKEYLDNLFDSLSEIIGSKGSQASLIKQTSAFLDEVIDKPFTLPERLSKFKEKVEGLGSLLLTLGQQPLELDSIHFLTTGDAIPKASAPFIKQFGYSLGSFVSSFTDDYNTFATDNKNSKVSSLSVWASTGRDQAQIIKAMIDDLFVKSNNVKIELKLVDTGPILLQATLAGKGPNIALLVPRETPINLAMRGGLVDLKKYDVDSIYDQFYPSAWIPYEYQDGVYAIPETQLFDMLFYRKDILKELNLSVPNTWNQFYDMIKKVQEANLIVGIQEMDRNNLAHSVAISTFDKLLFQNGGTYYNKEYSKTMFDDEIAYQAFEKVVQLYTYYGLDREFDFYNRFRTGEMPISIQNYGLYNLLTQAAPEIRGLWAMAPVPGTLKADGTIDRSESSHGSGCIMLKSAENQGKGQLAYDFMKWWVSAETQTRYANDLEAIMGTAARYSPANKVAFEKIPWNIDENKELKSQWKWVKDVRQIPGNYYITRSLTSAIRLSIDSKTNARRNLSLFNKDINSEISRKRKEFNIG